jgi:hypothetical protein
MVLREDWRIRMDEMDILDRCEETVCMVIGLDLVLVNVIWDNGRQQVTDLVRDYMLLEVMHESID